MDVAVNINDVLSNLAGAADLFCHHFFRLLLAWARAALRIEGPVRVVHCHGSIGIYRLNQQCVNLTPELALTGAPEQIAQKFTRVAVAARFRLFVQPPLQVFRKGKIHRASHHPILANDTRVLQFISIHKAPWFDHAALSDIVQT